uniref:Uncharacterized protein n=1 Tax=Saccharolobus solfataricus (strain 98/2) TaxID=555311 RepID=D0KSK4_SACS9
MILAYDYNVLVGSIQLSKDRYFGLEITSCWLNSLYCE